VYIIVGAVLCICLVLIILAIGIYIGRRDRDADQLQAAIGSASPEMTSAHDVDHSQNYSNSGIHQNTQGYTSMPPQQASAYANTTISVGSEEYSDVFHAAASTSSHGIDQCKPFLDHRPVWILTVVQLFRLCVAKPNQTDDGCRLRKSSHLVWCR
jgi:hypothetical protein